MPVTGNGVVKVLHNYLWDDDNILEELNGSNALIAHYTDFPGYWGGLSSERLAGDESEFYLFDLQSSNRLLLDASVATSNEYLYKAFGEKVLSTGSVRNPFQFQGQSGPYFDAPNRTVMRARIQDPTTGRWFSEDPIGFGSGDWNLYRFVGNNPLNWINPSGLLHITEIKKLACPVLTHLINTIVKGTESEVKNLNIGDHRNIEERYYDLLEDKLDLFSFRPGVNPSFPDQGTWETHLKKYDTLQRFLNRALREYISKYCDEPPTKPCNVLHGKAWFWARKPAPSEHWKNSHPVKQRLPQHAFNWAAVGAGAVVVGKYVWEGGKWVWATTADDFNILRALGAGNPIPILEDVPPG